MPSISSSRVVTQDAVFHVREIGSGPLVVFLHGMMSSAAVWDPIMRMLGARFRCIALDQRGHGLSDGSASEYSARSYAGDVLALVAALDAGPAALVGHSLGARNAVVAGRRDPASVQSVVAVDYVPFVEKEVLDALEARTRVSDRLYASRAEIEADIHARLPKLPYEAVRQRANTLFREVEGGFRQLASAPAMALATQGLREDFAPAFKALACPALILCGADSNVVSPAALEATRRARPDIPIVTVPDADHFVIEEAPLVCANAIMEFMGAQLPPRKPPG